MVVLDDAGGSPRIRVGVVSSRTAWIRVGVVWWYPFRPRVALAGRQRQARDNIWQAFKWYVLSYDYLQSL